MKITVFTVYKKRVNTKQQKPVFVGWVKIKRTNSECDSLLRSADRLTATPERLKQEKATGLFGVWDGVLCLVFICCSGGFKNVGFRYLQRVSQAVNLTKRFVIMHMFRHTRFTQPTRTSPDIRPVDGNTRAIETRKSNVSAYPLYPTYKNFSGHQTG